MSVEKFARNRSKGHAKVRARRTNNRQQRKRRLVAMPFELDQRMIAAGRGGHTKPRKALEPSALG